MNAYSTVIRFTAVISVAALLSACQPSSQQQDVQSSDQPVKVVVVKSDLNEPVRQFPGRVAASESANVASKVAGQVIKLHANAGDEIDAGALLVELDDTDYQLNLKQAQANYNLAKVSFDRVSSSRERNIATQADFDNARANLDKAEVGLQQARNQLEDTKVRAPFAGTVVRVLPQTYDFVAAAQPLVMIQSTENIDVLFQVPSDIIAKINEDVERTNVDVIFDAYPNTVYSADVREFSASSDRSTRSFDVTLTLKSPPRETGTLLPGMDATVLLDVARISDQPELTIPSHAVFYRNGQAYVWKVLNNRAVQTGVTLGDLRGDQITVTEGLDVGQQIVAAGVSRLVDGDRVVIWDGE